MLKEILTPQDAEWQQRTGKKNTQMVLNCVLWGIIMDKGGGINVSCEEVKNLPDNIISVEVTNGRVYLTAKKGRIRVILN